MGAILAIFRVKVSNNVDGADEGRRDDGSNPNVDVMNPTNAKLGQAETECTNQNKVDDKDSKVEMKYAEAVKQTPNTAREVNFRYLEAKSVKDGVDVILSAESIRKFEDQKEIGRDVATQKKDKEPVDSSVTSTNRFAALGSELGGDDTVLNEVGSSSGLPARMKDGDDSDDDVEENPDDQDIRASEEKCLKDYQQACIDEEGFLKQKAKVHWLAVGDANTRYFHNYVKGRNHRARIHSIKDMNGMEWEGDQMIQQFVSHYNSFLGGQHTVSRVPSDDLFTSRLNHHVALDMIAPVEKDEIKMSAECVLKVLKRFADMSGLTPSNHKSTVYFCHVPPGVKKSITDLLPFEEGKLPVRYLGVPLITKRVRYTDCSALIERMDKRISLWLNKFLSFAGRLQLIRFITPRAIRDAGLCLSDTIDRIIYDVLASGFIVDLVTGVGHVQT
ncbi:hypothetical protein QVD17_39765 [Tagetes erecta]|uniref:Uncharacterized protein n=1 Tax=Tagetes erecta TaxID=13708 RepID=A0AAD8JT16_TARER|nr:hypothetical protein QVD17_39765 [Tagetes erecta]